MRISLEQKLAILRGIKEIVRTKNTAIKIFLFGSRADDTKKGGDIDLLLLCDRSVFDSLNREKYKIISRIKKYLGDQHIDLTIINDCTKNDNDFYLSIKNDLIELIE